MTEQEKKMWADDVAMIGMLREEKEELQARIDRALKKIDNMFDNGDESKIIDDLLGLEKILKGE